jgi:hypothetical protein
MLEVYRAAGEAEAHIIKGLLEENGIPCFLKYHTVPAVFDSIGEVRVMVDDAMAEEAKRLISREDDAEMVGGSG